MVTMSHNGKLILEAYEQTGLKTQIKSGWATVSQKNELVGLKVLVNALLPDGIEIVAGSLAYIKEESLSTQPWAKARYKTKDSLGEFIIANISDVEYTSPPEIS